MTEDGREILEQVVGGAGNITLQMEDCVTIAQRRIHCDGVRPIRSDEIEDALKEAGIEIPQEVAGIEEVTEDDDALKMPVAVNWAGVESGITIEFRDNEGEIAVGRFENINEDGSLSISVNTGDDAFEARVLPENVRLPVDGPRILQGVGELADAVGLSADQRPQERPAAGPPNLSPGA